MAIALEAIIGLEVHAQVRTETKMFCACENDAFGKPPNTTVCPICMGHPGTLPVPNSEAIRRALTASIALHCTVEPHCHFDRKHYFYPDLPSGFQISQYDFPLAREGWMEFEVPPEQSNRTHKCRIHRLHLENDAGKLTHRGDVTLCDFNRAGTPLMEIVTEPDLRSPTEAVAFAQELRRTLIAVGTSEADMYKGMMRFDASISLRDVGAETLNPRSEIKNLNSFKGLERALTYEEARLRKLSEEERGPLKHNVTVGWLDDEGRTRVLRDKETADDYRYFPEPDIPPLTVSRETLEGIVRSLPPLPRELREQYVHRGLSPSDAQLLVDEPSLRTLFDAVERKTGDSRRASSIVLTQLLGFLNAAGKTPSQAPSDTALLELVEAVDDGTISSNAAKQVLEEMVTSGKSARAIITDRGLTQIVDTRALEDIVRRAIDVNAEAVASYRNGKPQALSAIVGWVMKETKGQANPKVVSELLQKHIE